MKLVYNARMSYRIGSPPLRGRGLKLVGCHLCFGVIRRPPCGGVD